jgi:hypothetical protein
VRIPPSNHRYCGWRESAKIVPLAKILLSDIAEQHSLARAAQEAYIAWVAEQRASLSDQYADAFLLIGMSGDIGLIQSARMLIDYTKETK